MDYIFAYGYLVCKNVWQILPKILKLKELVKTMSSFNILFL